jgi:hypothetical protein
MDKLSLFLLETCGANLSQDFVKSAVYNEEMDFLEYVSKNDVTVSDRVDGFLTVMWNYDQDEIVGFRLKGFRCIFNDIIKPLSKLKDEDFDPLVEALEKIFTKLGDEIFSNQSNEDYRVKAYKSALHLIKSDKVDLPDQFKRAA